MKPNFVKIGIPALFALTLLLALMTLNASAATSTITCPSNWGSEWSCKNVDGQKEVCKNNGTSCWCSKSGTWSNWKTGKCTIKAIDVTVNDLKTEFYCYGDWYCRDTGNQIKATKNGVSYCTYDKTGARRNLAVAWSTCNAATNTTTYRTTTTTYANSNSWVCYSDWLCLDQGSYVKAIPRKGSGTYCTYDKAGAKANQNVNWFSC